LPLDGNTGLHKADALSMSILIEKILTIFILPVSLSLSLGLMSALFLGLQRRRFAGVMLALSLGCLWVFSTPVITQSLMASLQQQIPSVAGKS
jgi:hypothetical protein